MRLRAGPPAGPHLAGMQGCRAAKQGCCPGSLPPHYAASGWPPGRPSTRWNARLRTTRLAKLEAAQAWPPGLLIARAAVRGCCPDSFPPRDAASGRPTGQLLPCWSARLRAKRLAKFGAA
eukprot:scaffold37284_cov50-Phaeocystis_antarctica.AAC.1